MSLRSSISSEAAAIPNDIGQRFSHFRNSNTDVAVPVLAPMTAGVSSTSTFSGSLDALLRPSKHRVSFFVADLEDNASDMGETIDEDKEELEKKKRSTESFNATLKQEMVNASNAAITVG